jgi:hypothetical protein
MSATTVKQMKLIHEGEACQEPAENPIVLC